MNIDPAISQEVSLIAVLLTSLGGVITSLGPCNIATVAILQIFHGICSRPDDHVYIVGNSYQPDWWEYPGLVLSGGSDLFVIGLQMLGVFIIPFQLWLGGLREKVGLKGIPGALGLGLGPGLIASQCATPVMAAILTYVMAKRAMIYGTGLLLVYGLGRGVPVELAGTFTGALKQMQALGRCTITVEMISGLVIIAVG